MTRILIVVALLALLAGVRPLLAVRRRGESAASVPDVSLAEVVGDLDRSGWVVFTTPYCASCGPVIAELEAAFPDDGVLAFDAVVYADLADELGVRRSPTVFEIDEAGRITDRHVGAERVRSRIPHATAG